MYIMYVTNAGDKAVLVSSDNKMHNDNPIDYRALLKVDIYMWQLNFNLSETIVSLAKDLFF